jgi:hypothetical protein
MPDYEAHLREILQRLESLEGKVDTLHQKVGHLTERVEMARNYLLRTLPTPPDVTEAPHLPGLG